MAMLNEHFLSGGRRVPLEIFLPAAAGKHPLVLVLHGSFGLQPPYRAGIVSFAEALASNGIAATIPHYLEATGSASLSGDDVMKLIPAKRPAWRQACGDALISMAKDARFDASRLGILGFSLGANLALSLAMDPPGGTTMRNVVDFFGPTQLLENHWSNLPPILILHGDDDHVVERSESAHVVEELKKAGKKVGSDFEFEWYEGEGHGFKDPALTKSRVKTVEFLKKTL